MKGKKLSLTELVYANLLRYRIVSWLDIYKFYQILPSEVSLSETSKVDPLWLLTQSAKNYQLKSLEKVYSFYTRPEFFKVCKSNFGLSNRFIDTGTLPYWGYLQQQNWYWMFLKHKKICFWLSTIPGVKSISVVGSTSLHLTRQNSDLDLIFECSKGFVLFVRLLVKIVLKVSKMDVSSFFLSIKMFLMKKHNAKGSLQKNTLDQILNYKNRTGTKVDAGLFYCNNDDIEKYFGRDYRQLWIWKGLRVWPNEVESEIFDSCITYDKHKVWHIFARIFIRSIWIIFTPLLYLLSLLQLPFYKIKNGYNPNRPVSFSFISFYPLFHEDKYLAKKYNY